MSERVSATEAARRFSDLLNRVRYGRESFVIVRGGEEVGQLVPAPSAQALTLRGLVGLLREVEAPDERFADDLEQVQASQPFAGDSPWAS